MKKGKTGVGTPIETTGINTTVDADAYKGFGAETIEEQIYNFIKTMETVSFIDIAKEFGRGNEALTVAKNMVLWTGLTEDAASGITNLIKSNRITLVDGSQIAYLFGGEMLNLPIAKRPPKNGYKTPHWVVAFLKVVN